MRICISSAHSLRVRGASGVLDEVNESRKVVDRVTAILRNTAGVTVHSFSDNTSTSQAQNINTIVAWHNRHQRDRDISVHFNHSGGGIVDRAIGTEVLYVSQAGLAIATRVSRAMADAGKFINRGAKRFTTLGFLNRTTRPSALLEVCFCNSRGDARLYNQHLEAIVRAIATSIRS